MALASADGAPRWHASSSDPREQQPLSREGDPHGSMHIKRRMSWDDIYAPRGPALLLSVRCFKPSSLESPASVRRVFVHYSGENHDAMAATDFEALTADMSAARAITDGRGRVLFRGATATARARPLKRLLDRGRRALAWSLAKVGHLRFSTLTSNRLPASTDSDRPQSRSATCHP